MFAVLPKVRPENRHAVNGYLLQIYEPVTTLQCSVNACPSNDALRARFKIYVDSEEERLTANLQAVNYDIDEMDTLALVTGPGRIDKVSTCQQLLRRLNDKICMDSMPCPLYTCSSSVTLRSSEFQKRESHTLMNFGYVDVVSFLQKVLGQRAY